MKVNNLVVQKILVGFMLLTGIGQVLGQIRGRVSDVQDNPIPFANVVLYQASDTIMVTGAITDDVGHFSLETHEAGSFIVRVTYIGFADYYTEPFNVDSSSPALQLGNLILTENVNELDEVVLEAKRYWVQRTSEGRVINVQSSVMTKGSNTLQVLERLPGVLMDRRNNQFSLNGQNGVTVMFNGRKMPLSMDEVMSLLEGTLADTIEKIELITSPSANYDVDGGAGIINIVFKKNEYEGDQLNVNTSLGYGFKEKASASLQYAYGKNKLSINTSYSILNDHAKNGFEGSGTDNMPFIGAPSHSWFSTNFNHNRNAHNLNIGAIYQLDSITGIGGELAYTLNRIQSVSDINNSRKAENQDFFRYHISSEMDTKKIILLPLYT